MLQRFLGGYVVGHAAHLAGTYLQRVDPLFVDLDRGLETKIEQAISLKQTRQFSISWKTRRKLNYKKCVFGITDNPILKKPQQFFRQNI